MSTKARKGARTFTFDIPEDFRQTFDEFQKIAGEGERSTAAQIRILIKKKVEQAGTPEAS